MGKRSIDHIGIVVRNLDVSIKFYTEVLGLELKQKLLHTNGIFQLAFLGYGNQEETEIELIQGYSDQLGNEATVHHFAIAVANLDEEFARLQAWEKVTLIDSEITTLPNGYRYFFIYGPEQEWIELFQR
ncbi:lactoylglutathione lyase [Paenibacillus shirakamiensis]|uniref:Lactoylglutathione lyase n=1 Tax=Paenibacillus shirakamiensis TaxID=1265935 RepID=A0ABS4JIT9_9BACL|nr:VOC family protein [Paenibacillus shirakamiensis]MBP2001602.1 lactoylglutathione lyase [Paenibacillus shirakamiensis]